MSFDEGDVAMMRVRHQASLTVVFAAQKSVAHLVTLHSPLVSVIFFVFDGFRF